MFLFACVNTHRVNTLRTHDVSVCVCTSKHSILHDSMVHCECIIAIMFAFQESDVGCLVFFNAEADPELARGGLGGYKPLYILTPMIKGCCWLCSACKGK